jgi:hypothetical protein
VSQAIVFSVMSLITLYGSGRPYYALNEIFKNVTEMSDLDIPLFYYGNERFLHK